jgi:hypothetical protein
MLLYFAGCIKIGCIKIKQAWRSRHVIDKEASG